MTLSFAIENVVDPAAEVYVERPQDDELLLALRSSFVSHVQGSRMSGKSSLLLRTAKRLGSEGVRTLYADLSTIDHAGPSRPLEATRYLLTTLARRARLDVPACLDDTNMLVPADLLCAGFGELASGHALRDPGPSVPALVVLLDEFDVVADSRWGRGFLGVLRDVASRRHSDSALASVRIVAAGVRPFRHLVGDPSGFAAFAADAAVWLDDFAIDNRSAEALAAGFPPHLESRASALAWKALEFSGGYPQACTWLCRAMIDRHAPSELSELDHWLGRLADAERRSTDPPLFFSYPADYIRSFVQQAAGTTTNPREVANTSLWVYRDLLDDHPVHFDASSTPHLLLRWAGLARCSQDGALRLRSPMLRRLYTSAWLRQTQRAIHAASGATAITAAAPPDRRPFRPRPKVYVLTTGGTIGMVEDDQGNVRAPRAFTELNAAYQVVGRVADVEFRTIFDNLRDSANIVPDHWRRIALEIASLLRDDPSAAGVVVAHGTDTLAYTASAVAYALGANLTKPVVFTGSQATVQVQHGDALLNLLRSCQVAATAGVRLPEVVICFGDLVLRACLAQKKDDRRFDGFESPLGPPLAVVTEEIEYNEPVLRRHRTPPPPLDLRAVFDSGILTISQVPGLRPELLDPVLSAGVARHQLRGIIIQSLGAGNLPTEPGYSLVDFIERATREDIPVILGSQYPVLTTNPGRYAPAQHAMEAGAVDVFNTTLPALVTKLAWILGQRPEDDTRPQSSDQSRRMWVRQRIRTSYVGECPSDPVDQAYGTLE